MRYSTGLLALAGAALAACGGGGAGTGGPARQGETGAPAQTAQAPAGSASAGAPMPPAAPASAATVPSWMKVNDAAKTVAMDIRAGKTAGNNHWNFNGYDHGNATITVPVGYKVTLDFSNGDPVLAHSIGVDTRTGDFEATMTPQPAFPNAVSPDPTSPSGGTQPNKSSTVTFSADKAGQYSLVCYMPGHAAAGMWIHFNVVSGGKAGVATGS